MIILIIIIILNFLIIIIIILLITMLTILLTTISLKNTIPSKHYLQFLSIKKHLVLIRKKKLKHIKLLIIHFIIIIIIIIIICSSQGTVGNIRWSPTANSNMIHAHGILQIALKTSFVLCQPTNAAAHRDKCVTPLVIYSTTR